MFRSWRCRISVSLSVRCPMPLGGWCDFLPPPPYRRIFISNVNGNFLFYLSRVVAYDENVRFGNYLVSTSTQHNNNSALDINGPLAKLQKSRLKFSLYIYNWVVWLIDWLTINRLIDLIDWLIDWLITCFFSFEGPEWLLANKCLRNWEGPWFWVTWSPNFCCAVPWTQPRNIELGWVVTLNVLWITVPVSTLHK